MSSTVLSILKDTTTARQLSKATICSTNYCAPRPQASVIKAGLGGQMSSFFSNLFNTDNWPARWHCGSWTEFEGWLYVFSDILIWASYFAIPVLLVIMLKKRPDIPFPKIIWLFGAFIILCGTTHLLDAIIFWWPAYRLSALIRFFTGIVSAITLYTLYRVMPKVFSLRSVEELEHEIAERKAAEEKLLKSEFLLEEAGRMARMGAWEFDMATQRSIWSQMVYNIYELPYNMDLEALDPYSFFVEPYAQQLRDALAAAYAKGTGWDLELHMITAKGHKIWVRSIGKAFYSEDGQLVKLQGMMMDIDKQKTNELALSRSHDLLFQSHQQLKTFTHILSHNIRNHASNISLLTDLFDAETLDENNLELFQRIVRVSRGLNGTLNDLAHAIQIKESIVDAEPLFFKELILHTLEMMDAEIEANGVIIETDLQVAGINYPKLYLESILMNLVSNAIKYRRNDAAPHIFIKTFKDGDRVALSCRDNGLGIDLELHAEKIFGLYKTFHDHKEAHGIGLFLIKTQVESQGGTINVTSKPGEGSTFTVKF